MASHARSPLSLTRAHSVLVLSFCLLMTSCAELEPTPLDDKHRPLPVLRSTPQFRAIEGTEGFIREAPLFATGLALQGARIEIRTLVVRPDRVVKFSSNHDVALEVRSGEIEMTASGKRDLQRPGDQWFVPANSTSELRVVGQLAVLRAIYLVTK